MLAKYTRLCHINKGYTMELEAYRGTSTGRKAAWRQDPLAGRIDQAADCVIPSNTMRRCLVLRRKQII
jgi:hypothetical protein